MVLVRGGIIVRRHVQYAADILVERFGPSLSPGTYNGHSPPEGPTQALDLFNSEDTTGWALQSRVADFLIAHAKELGVRYVIKWNPNGVDFIWNIERAAEGWRAMATRDHRNHVHVTFYASAPNSGDTSPIPSIPTMKELEHMDFTYIYNGEDWVFLASLGYFGKLPFGATLDGLKHHKLLYSIGGTDKSFHEGLIALAATVGMQGIR